MVHPFPHPRTAASADRVPIYRLTLAGGGWEEEIAGQQLFIDEMNLERYGADRTARMTEIVVLCGSTDCIEYCAKKKIWAYGGYQYNKPEILLKFTWIKLKGLIDILVSPLRCRRADLSTRGDGSG